MHPFIKYFHNTGILINIFVHRYHYQMENSYVVVGMHIRVISGRNSNSADANGRNLGKALEEGTDVIEIRYARNRRFQPAEKERGEAER